MLNTKEKLNKTALGVICKKNGCNNTRYSLYYCKQCLISENERKKLLHRRKYDEGKCANCGRDNNNSKWLCDECGIKNNIVNQINRSNKAVKFGYYGKLKQIMEII